MRNTARNDLNKFTKWDESFFMSHKLWRHRRLISSRTAEVERIFLKLKKNKKSNQIQKMVIRTGSKDHYTSPDQPDSVTSVLVRRCRPNNQKEKNEFQRGCVSYEGVFSLAESQPGSTFRQPISSEIIESRTLIGPSKIIYYNKSNENFTYLIGQALWWAITWLIGWRHMMTHGWVIMK